MVHLRYPTSAKAFLMLVVLAACVQAHGATLSGQVLKVESGATLVLDMGMGQYRRVLLSGITPPAPGTKIARDARNQLHMLLAGKFVTVVYSELTPSADSIGRVLHGGGDVNVRMLESGLVRLNPDARLEAGTLSKYLAAQKRAQELGFGLWRRQFTPRP